MPYDAEAVREFFERAVEREGEGADPAFCAVAGSHVYGFAGPDSDVDVHGIHVADARRYALLDRPAQRVRINQDGVTQGYEDYPEMDLVSFELRTLAERLLQANFNVVEFVLAGDVVVDRTDGRMDDLRAVVEDELPLDVPNSLWGLAKSTYEGHLVEGRDGYDPGAKNYLYAVRALLAAEYLVEHEALEADARTLARDRLGDDDLVTDLIGAKRGGATLDERTRERADALLDELFDRVETPRDVDKSAYRRTLDDWLRDYRRAVAPAW